MNEDADLLRDLPRDAASPPGLEDRVVERLRREGAFRQRRRISLPAAAAIAATLFIAGFGAAKWSDRQAGASSSAYVLLLHEGPRSEESHVAEYVAWSRQDFVVGGQKLGDRGKLMKEAAVIDADFGRAGQIGGFFIVAADSLERAAELARTCPHLRYGGTIEVRPIER